VIGIKSFCCKHCGLDCSFEAIGMNEGHVAKMILKHMHEDHDMKVIPADFMIKIKQSINTMNTVHYVRPVTEKEMLLVR
jgi:predicted small metal-binding protein